MMRIALEVLACAVCAFLGWRTGRMRRAAVVRLTAEHARDWDACADMVHDALPPAHQRMFSELRIRHRLEFAQLRAAHDRGALRRMADREKSFLRVFVVYALALGAIVAALAWYWTGGK